MTRKFLSLICIALFLLGANDLKAQNLTPDWAKQAYNSKSFSGGSADVAVDKHGNIYALQYEKGRITTGGQSTQDSTAYTVLTSWDCNGNLRWMKSFGAKAYLGAGDIGLQLETDTLGGVYVFGTAETPQGSDSLYWDADTSMNVAAGNYIGYLVKYDTLGQFHWLRTPVYKYAPNSYYWSSSRLSVSPSGEVFLFSLLDTGVYNGGSFTVNTRMYYAVSYNTAGIFQSAIPLDMTPPDLSGQGNSAVWSYDPATDRFYSCLTYNTGYGILIAGNTTLTLPIAPITTAVLGAFNRQGQNLWVRQANINNKSSALVGVVFGKDGTLYLKGSAQPGAIFFGDTAKNASGQASTDFTMALDTNAGLLWSKYAASANGWGAAYVSEINQVNNLIAVVGLYGGTLSWDNLSVSNNGQSLSAYVLIADATKGTAKQLVSFSSSGSGGLSASALDKNSNLYIGGYFQGNLSFGGNSLSSLPNANTSNSLLLKYKNVDCNCNLLQPAFTVTSISGMTLQFTYTGQTPYSSISWDFGDGSPAASGPNPTHTYVGAGPFPACVTVTNACGSNTTCQYITDNITGVADVDGVFSSVNVYPNPAKDELTIAHLTPGTTVEVLDVLGRRMKVVHSDSGTLRLNVSDLSAGIHLLRFTDRESKRGSRAFVKQ